MRRGLFSLMCPLLLAVGCGDDAGGDTATLAGGDAAMQADGDDAAMQAVDPGGDGTPTDSVCLDGDATSAKCVHMTLVHGSDTYESICEGGEIGDAIILPGATGGTLNGGCGGPDKEIDVTAFQLLYYDVAPMAGETLTFGPGPDNKLVDDGAHEINIQLNGPIGNYGVGSVSWEVAEVTIDEFEPDTYILGTAHVEWAAGPAPSLTPAELARGCNTWAPSNEECRGDPTPDGCTCEGFWPAAAPLGIAATADFVFRFGAKP